MYSGYLVDFFIFSHPALTASVWVEHRSAREPENEVSPACYLHLHQMEVGPRFAGPRLASYIPTLIFPSARCRISVVCQPCHGILACDAVVFIKPASEVLHDFVVFDAAYHCEARRPASVFVFLSDVTANKSLHRNSPCAFSFEARGLACDLFDGVAHLSFDGLWVSLSLADLSFFHSIQQGHRQLTSSLCPHRFQRGQLAIWS